MPRVLRAWTFVVHGPTILRVTGRGQAVDQRKRLTLALLSAGLVGLIALIGSSDGDAIKTSSKPPRNSFAAEMARTRADLARPDPPVHIRGPNGEVTTLSRREVVDAALAARKHGHPGSPVDRTLPAEMLPAGYSGNSSPHSLWPVRN